MQLLLECQLELSDLMAKEWILNYKYKNNAYIVYF